MVELASGTAYFSAWLARAGARTVAVDLSGEQLVTALRLQRQHGPVFPLVQGDAEHVPLADGCADLVVSEHGAAAWCDPARWLPEAARLLRPGGRLVFLTNSHLSALCVPADEGVAQEQLLRGQREAYKVQWPGGGVEFHPSHGDWVRLLRGRGSSSTPCTSCTPRPTATTTRSTRSSPPTGRGSGRPRSCGWPPARDRRQPTG